MKKFLLASIALVLSLLLHTSSAQGVSQSILNYMATRRMRYHHYMWHQVRENWNYFSNNVRNQFSNIGWAPPNPTVDSRGRRITSNYAGEDFLFMHRQMLGTARSIASFTSWGTIPAPGDRSYPVPSNYGWGNTNSFKTNNYYYGSIQGEEQYLKNPSTLRRMSLNDLGNRIERGIHQSMHLRWSAYSSYGYRVGGASNGVPNINKQWDNPNYNWLVDTYASQANGWFYKLHGWIDDRVEDWRRANGLSSVRWSGTWTGGPMSNLGSVLNKVGDPAAGMQMQNMNEDPDAVGDVLEKAFEIFAKSGVPEFFIGSRGTTLPPRKRKVVKTCGKGLKKAKKI